MYIANLRSDALSFISTQTSDGIEHAYKHLQAIVCHSLYSAFILPLCVNRYSFGGRPIHLSKKNTSQRNQSLFDNDRKK